MSLVARRKSSAILPDLDVNVENPQRNSDEEKAEMSIALQT